jgi:NTP pyrophosphatase (non-canonical NTP hydrolase)
LKLKMFATLVEKEVPVVPKTAVFSHKTGEPITVECEKCYDEEGSFACVRAAHQHQFKNKGIFMSSYEVLVEHSENMGFEEYAKYAVATAEYPNIGENLVYPALGLVGEAGEVAEKVKKIWRNKGTISPRDVDAATKEMIVKEMGDVLWYLAALSGELGVPLSKVAFLNLEKLNDRRARNVIKSEGDER